MALRTDVSVLYVDPRGPYPKLVADWWDEARDARNYAGPNLIVAHPPCGPWGSLKHLCLHQPKDLGPIAVEQVQRWGGVLEHPQHSGLFAFKQLPTPGQLPDRFGGRTIEIEQVDYGHVARKPTWLYIVGSPRSIRWGEPGKVTHWISGGRAQRTRCACRHEKLRHSRSKGCSECDCRSFRAGGAYPPDKKICSAQQRRRTPLAFAEWLLDLASHAGKRDLAE